MFDKLVRFLNTMDARALRAVMVSVGLFFTVAVVLVMGKTTAVFDADDAPLITWMQSNASSPWALPATILVFTLAAFVGAPQFVLMAAAVVAFGPVLGFLYSWIATMVSTVVTFALGRRFGADLLRRYGGNTVNRVSQFVGRNGFMTGLLVRIVPSAPFIVVNMAAGVSHVRAGPFMAGTAIGIIPKAALVAFAGGGVIALGSGASWMALGALGAGLAIWIALVLFARRRMPPPVDEAT